MRFDVGNMIRGDYARIESTLSADAFARPVNTAGYRVSAD